MTHLSNSIEKFCPAGGNPYRLWRAKADKTIFRARGFNFFKFRARGFHSFYFARADFIHFISRALLPVHGKIVSTSFYNTTIPMTICSVATFITKSQSKSEHQVSEDGGKRYTTMTRSCEKF